MMLCEDTMGSYTHVVHPSGNAKPVIHLTKTESVMVVQKQERKEAPVSIPESLLKAKIPKNKNAKRRLVATIHENIDRYARGSSFKKNGRPMPSDLAVSIRKIR